MKLRINKLLVNIIRIPEYIYTIRNFHTIYIQTLVMLNRNVWY